MTYPIAPPELKIAWDNEVSFESSAIEQRFDGGIDFRNTRGQLNQMLRSRSISSTLIWGEYLIIDAFFSANIGKPFYFEDVLYICESYTWNILDYKPPIVDGGIQIKPSTGLFRLEASLQEVVRV